MWVDRQSDDSHGVTTSDYSRGPALWQGWPGGGGVIALLHSRCLKWSVTCSLRVRAPEREVRGWEGGTYWEGGARGKWPLQMPVFRRCGVRPECHRGREGWSGRWNNRGIISFELRWERREWGGVGAFMRKLKGRGGHDGKYKRRRGERCSRRGKYIYIYKYICYHLFVQLCCMLHKLFSMYLYIDIKIASIFTVLR